MAAADLLTAFSIGPIVIEWYHPILLIVLIALIVFLVWRRRSQM